jgi:hypothetical protein
MNSFNTNLRKSKRPNQNVNIDYFESGNKLALSSSRTLEKRELFPIKTSKQTSPTATNFHSSRPSSIQNFDFVKRGNRLKQSKETELTT